MMRVRAKTSVTVCMLLLLVVLADGAGLRDRLSVYEQRKYKRQVEDDDISSLYDANDSVIPLNAANLKENVFQQPFASLVEFYNSYCGFCRRFAPIWKQLAADVLGWRPYVKITALDCSREENNAICRDFEIMAYPTIRYYAPYYEDGEQQIGEPLKEHDGQRITERLVEHLQRVSKKPPGWPNFDIVNKTDDLASLFEGATSVRPKYIYLVNENEPNGTLGGQVILDFHDTPGMLVRRMQDTSESNGLSVVDGATFGRIKLPVDEFSREMLKKAIKKHLSEHTGITLTDVATKSTSKSGRSTEPSISEVMEHKQEEAIRAKVKELGPTVVYQADLEEALKFALYREIPRYKEIKEERLQALKRFLNVLVRFFPFNDNGRRYLTEIRQYVLNVSEQSLDGENFLARIKELEKERTPVFASNQWIGCSSSKAGLRRYPCGLWTLFHYLTVQAADSDLSTNPLEVLEAMHGFVEHFFGCSECSAHFQQMADRNKIWQVASKDEAILWLWSSHNEVNRRLAGDPTEDPEHPKSQFPSSKQCPKCQKASMTNHHNHQKYTINDGTEWDLVELLRFIKKMYTFENRSMFGLHTVSSPPARAQAWTADETQNEKPFGSVLSELDMRMGALLYVTCIVMIVIAIKLVVKRGYRKKMYSHDVFGKV